MSKETLTNSKYSFKNIINGDTDCKVYSHVILSEIILFLWAMGRTIWYIIFGVVNYNFDYVLPQSFWIAFFAVLSTTHLIGMYVRNSTLRLTAIIGYTLAWGTFTIFAILQNHKSVAVPSYIILTVSSLLIINSIYRSKFKS